MDWHIARTRRLDHGGLAWLTDLIVATAKQLRQAERRTAVNL